MKSRLKKLTKYQRDHLTQAIAFKYDLTGGATKLVRLFLDYEQGEKADFPLIQKKLGVSQATLYRYFDELRNKNVLAYERRKKRPK